VIVVERRRRLRLGRFHSREIFGMVLALRGDLERFEKRLRRIGTAVDRDLHLGSRLLVRACVPGRQIHDHEVVEPIAVRVERHHGGLRRHRQEQRRREIVEAWRGRVPREECGRLADAICRAFFEFVEQPFLREHAPLAGASRTTFTKVSGNVRNSSGAISTRRRPSRQNASPESNRTPRISPSCATFRGQRVIAENTATENPIPSGPSPALLSYVIASFGSTPRRPGGTAIGISKRASPVFVVRNCPSMRPTAAVSPAGSGAENGFATSAGAGQIGSRD